MLVVNPSAGGGRALRGAPGVAKTLVQGGWDLETQLSYDIAHARRLARKAALEGKIVVALGGDGLAGALSEEMAEVKGTLAVLPGGRGNDFVRSLGMPLDLILASRALLQARTRTIDLGWIEAVGFPPRSFLGVAGMGFDSYVQDAIAHLKINLGRAVYGYGAIKALRVWKQLYFDIMVDDQSHHMEGWLIAVANSGVFGGGMKIAPNASVDDGKLDVVAVGAMTKRAFLGTFPKVFVGKHLSHPAVQTWRATEVHIACESPVRLYADGELAGNLPAKVTVKPQVLTVLA